MMNRRRCDKRTDRVGSKKIARTLVVATVVITSVGCADILGIETIDSCWDPTGFEGRGCYRTGGDCKLTKEQLPNACTDSPFIVFDNQQELGFSAPDDLPKIKMEGAVVPADTGSSDPDECPTENRVIVAGSNAIVPVLSYISAALRSASTPITVLYKDPSSCHGAATIFKNVKIGGEFSYWIEEGKPLLTKVPCTMPDQVVDIGVSDVSGSTCGFDEGPDIAVDAPGPIQAMIFIAPKSSAKRAISAEAARLVYGFGGKHENFSADPWTNIAHIHRRNPTSGTQNLIGAYIGVPSSKFLGFQNASTSEMVTSMQNTATDDATATIGILDVVNRNIGGVPEIVRTLAYQAEGQNCAFFPDATNDSRDKRNVRDGHYALWGPIHIYSRPTPMANVTNVVKYLSLEQAPATAGKTADENMKELIRIVAGGHLVPTCAMRVQRASDGGPLLPQIPTRSCACYFDERTTETSCATCKADADCGSPDAPRCNFGFCEPQ